MSGLEVAVIIYIGFGLFLYSNAMEALKNDKNLDEETIKIAKNNKIILFLCIVFLYPLSVLIFNKKK